MNMKQNMMFLAACLLLAACSNGEGLRETLGLNRHGPDEFQVVSRPPLTLPPDFSLRPPKEGENAAYVPAISTRQQAHDTILGTAPQASASLAATAVQPVASGDLPSSADSRFLSNGGTQQANPGIRSLLIGQQPDQASKDNKYLVMPGGSGDPVVDAGKESARLKKDKQENLPPTAGGETPTMQSQSRGIFGDLF